MLNLIVGFVLGATAIIVAEAFCVYYFLNRMVNRSKSKSNPDSDSKAREVDHQQSLTCASNKQGTVWVLDPDKVPKVWAQDKAAAAKKELLDVPPVKKFAKIDGRSLILIDSDASQSTIHLSGCTVLAVSATNLSTRKWAKKFPVKIESGNIEIYKGTRTCYLYFETSWEKESWCKALRLASCVNKERTNWYAKLNEDFHDYITSLKAGYPSFMKPTSGFFCEPTDRAIRTDVSASKVRLFLKKFTKKSSKSGLDYKPGGMSMAVVEEKKIDEKYRSIQDPYPIGTKQTISTEKAFNNHLGENTVLPCQSPLTQSGSQGQVSVTPDVDSDDKFSIDEGTLCWNLLISRLFFDARHNTNMRSSIQTRIQRTLSNMRTPSYIGGVTCTSLDVGILPPHIHSMRVLPTDMNEVWAMEIDIEYSGGAILDIETRLEIREAEFEKGIVNANLDPNSVDEVTSDLLEGFEHFGKQLNLRGEIVDETEKKDEGDDKFDGMRKSNSWKSSYMSRWKCIANSIANHVSQVPISLAIKVASVRGTLRLHIKPPPSDQVWFGFTSMPEIDFNLDSSVGDHKISSTHVALLLENRFKAAIRETLVLPNCESVCIPWMIAEKDDWAPKRIAPFVRMNQETMLDSSGREVSHLEANKITKQSSNNQLVDKKESAKVTSVQLPRRESSESLRSVSQNSLTSSASSNLSIDKQSLQDLKTPLLSNEPETSSSSRSESPETHLVPRSVSSARENQLPTSEDGNGKRIGRRARMMDLGKKVSEKLEEKRRHLEAASLASDVDIKRSTLTPCPNFELRTFLKGHDARCAFFRRRLKSFLTRYLWQCHP